MDSHITKGSEVKSEAKKVTDWKVAYIIGLAGTILVTGVDGPLIGAIGSLGWIQILVTVIVVLSTAFFWQSW